MIKLIKTILFVMSIAITIPVNGQDDKNQTLSQRQQAIVNISSFTAIGNLVKLKPSLVAGLESGLTVNEIKEVLIHINAYCGFPRSLRGIQTFIEVLDERKTNGINDEIGRKATPISDKRSKYERGKENLGKLTGQSKEGTPPRYAVFAPEIEVFLKEHLFADLFERDLLTYAERELVTVSVNASIGGVEPMVKSHMNHSLTSGITPSQLKQLVNLIEVNVGLKEGDMARIVLREVLKSKGLNTDIDFIIESENGVKIQKVTFLNRININVVGNLYFPSNYDPTKKYAAIVIGPPFGSVKEQTSGIHAQKLAEMGYVTLAFDPSFRGESGGSPRQIDVPEIRVEDFSAAIDFLSNHPLVDKNRIGVLGVCASGSYSISAAQIDHRIKALATISMFEIGRARREGLSGISSYEQRMKTLDEIGEQRTKEFAGTSIRYVNSIPTKLTGQESDILREFYEYYRTPRGGHPRATNFYSYTSQAPLINFFPLVQIETISPRPLLFIVGERAESAYFSEDAYKKAQQPKELYVVPGASHVDLYDRPEYMKISLKKIDDFFKQYLK